MKKLLVLTFAMVMSANLIGYCEDISASTDITADKSSISDFSEDAVKKGKEQVPHPYEADWKGSDTNMSAPASKIQQNATKTIEQQKSDITKDIKSKKPTDVKKH